MAQEEGNHNTNEDELSDVITVIHDIESRMAPEKVARVDSVTMDVINKQLAEDHEQKLARRAVLATLGSNNPYLQNLLTDRLCGNEKKYKRVPLSTLFNGNITTTEHDLSQAVTESQQSAIEILNTSPEEIEQSIETTSDNNNPITSWVVNTLIQERFKEYNLRKSSDYWKKFNAIAALILPIGVCILEYFLMKKLGC